MDLALSRPRGQSTSRPSNFYQQALSEAKEDGKTIARPTREETARAYRASHTRGDTYAPLPFVGVDGEGGTQERYGHRYYVLRSGENYLSTDSPLSTEDCLSYIGGLPDGYIYVGFFFNYDVTMMLAPHAGFPLDKIAELLDKTKRKLRRDGQPFPVRWKNYEIEYIPSKRFSVGIIDKETNKVKKWRTIHDVAGFFQCSFVKALRTWEVGTPEQIALIEEGKANRAEFTSAVTDEELEYSRMECELLAELMDKVRSASREAQIPIRQYEGAGCLASGLLSKYQVSNCSGELPAAVQDAAQSAYFGGRFEVTGIGQFENVYQYDINSAYPYQCLSLPCLSHGHWQYHADRFLPGDSTVGLSHIRFCPALPVGVMGAMPICAPFPFRSKTGRIYYPLQGAGWYWNDEIRAAMDAPEWQWDITITESWEWVPKCEHRPFNFVPEYYTKRQEWGKDGRGKVIKLALNSLYGKTAQSVGRPRFSNPVWAGLITARTRALLYRLMCAAGDDILMTATDGIFSLKPLDVAVGKNLGEWSMNEYKQFFIVQAGIYFGGNDLLDTNKDRTKRTRGVPANVLHRNAFVKEWERAREDGIVTVPLHVFVGLRSGYHMGHYTDIGQWTDQDRNIRFRPYSRVVPEAGTWQGDGYMRTLPWPVCGWQDESTPYKKEIVPAFSRDIDTAWQEDQPDYGEYIGGIA